jgi:hypothetical protein
VLQHRQLAIAVEIVLAESFYWLKAGGDPFGFGDDAVAIAIGLLNLYRGLGSILRSDGS